MNHPHLMEDKELVGLYLQGHEYAFDTLYARHRERIFTSIYFLVNKRELAEDLFQETFIKIINVLKEKRYNEEGKFIGWALRIAHNLVIDYFRIQKNKMKMVYATETYDPLARIAYHQRNAMEEMIHNEKVEAVRQLVERLPQPQREVIVLRHYGDLTFKEIAGILGVNINTVLGRAHYGIIAMRNMLPGQIQDKKEEAVKIKKVTVKKVTAKKTAKKKVA